MEGDSDQYFVPPLIVKADDGLSLFSSLSAASVYIEVPDVENDVWGPAFDAEGRMVQISLPAELFEREPDGRLAKLRRKIIGPSFNLVEVKLTEREPSHQRELADLLGSSLGLSKTRDLPELVAAATDRLGISH